MITDDTLTLYYYDDGLTAGERQEVKAALSENADLAGRYAALCQQLERWREADSPRAPAHLVQRWHDSIDAVARSDKATAHRPRVPFHLLSFAWGAAVTAALAIGIGIGVIFSGNTVVDPLVDDPFAGIPAVTGSVVPASFTRGLQLHLQESQWEIATLPVDSAADRTRLLKQIVEQNRMFERAAKSHNAANLARVLRAFEPILMRLASEDISPEDMQALRAQLAFELNVMLTKLARDTSNEAQTI